MKERTKEKRSTTNNDNNNHILFLHIANAMANLPMICTTCWVIATLKRAEHAPWNMQIIAIKNLIKRPLCIISAFRNCFLVRLSCCSTMLRCTECGGAFVGIINQSEKPQLWYQIIQMCNIQTVSIRWVQECWQFLFLSLALLLLLDVQRALKYKTCSESRVEIDCGRDRDEQNGKE